MPLYEQESDTKGQPVEYITGALDASGQLEAVFDAMADGVFVYDGRGQLIKTNTAGRELLGSKEHPYARSSSLRDSAVRLRLRTPQGLPLTEEQWPVSRLLRGEELKGTQAPDVLVQTLTGEERLFSMSGSPMRDAQGQIVGGVIVIRDVTERNRMEDALRKSEAHYRTIVQTANEGIWLIAIDPPPSPTSPVSRKSRMRPILPILPALRTLYTNERLATMLGYSTAELLQRTVLDCIFPEDRASARLRLASNLLGRREQFEFRFRRNDGTPLEAMVSTSPIYDANGSIVSILGLFTDITARKHIEEALRQNEEMLRVALRNSSIAVFQQDRDLRYLWMYNPPSATPESIVGKTDADFVSPEEAMHLTKIKQQVLTSGESAKEEVQIVTAYGIRSQLLTFEPLRDHTGAIVGLTGTSINITERKQMEQRTYHALQALIAIAQVIVQGTEGETRPIEKVKKARTRTQRRDCAILFSRLRYSHATCWAVIA